MSAAHPLPRVFLCPGDESGWAVDEDRRQTAAALEGVVRLVDRPEDAQIIHACWWVTLMNTPAAALRGKPVICHMAGDPARCVSETGFVAAMARATHWIAQSRGALDKLRVLGRRAALVPYAIDPDTFAEPQAPASDVVRAAKAALPPNTCIIANFHRDTAGAAYAPGMDCPKLVKGPDVFVEILAGLHDRGVRVAALLAGPRRHWTRKRLRQRGVPVVFAGHETADEDFPLNILPPSQIAHLYAAADLCLMCSRSEGGPRGVLEAAAAGLGQLSTPVGLAPDILSADCLFTDPADAIDRIRADIATRCIRNLAPAQRELVRASYTAAANRERWRSVYASLIPPATGEPAPIPAVAGRERIVSFWNKFTPPPWGGGNQFMMALKAQAERMGIRATENGEGPAAAAHVVNSVQFDIERFRQLVRPGSCRVVHRLDGPISLLRGTPESLDADRVCFDLNREYATATVIQSWHTIRAIAELGFTPVRPVLIINACDPTIFYPPPKPRTPGDKLRIIATAWSPNPGKGAAIYRWMDEHLDPARYEFTFVGNSSVKLRAARVIEPLPSEALARELREHDVYITASRNDPCSNSVIEALACGLPALYLDSGGHPELVSFGGLPFSRPSQIPELLDRIRRHHAMYRRLITPTSIEDVCRRYLDLLLGDQPYLH